MTKNLASAFHRDRLPFETTSPLRLKRGGYEKCIYNAMYFKIQD